MTQIPNLRRLVQAQQGEVDAVALYLRLASLAKSTIHREAFLRIAADKGIHAAALRRYTGLSLTPGSLKTHMVAALYRILGHRRTLAIIQKGEYDAARSYSSLVADFPRVRQIMEDEFRHGNLLGAMRA